MAAQLKWLKISGPSSQPLKGYACFLKKKKLFEKILPEKFSTLIQRLTYVNPKKSFFLSNTEQFKIPKKTFADFSNKSIKFSLKKTLTMKNSIQFAQVIEIGNKTLFFIYKK